MKLSYFLKNMFNPERLALAIAQDLRNSAEKILTDSNSTKKEYIAAQTCLTGLNQNSYTDILKNAALDLLVGVGLANLLTILVGVFVSFISIELSLILLTSYAIGIFPISLVGPIRMILLLIIHLNRDLTRSDKNYKSYIRRLIFSLPLLLNYSGWICFYHSFLDHPEVITTLKASFKQKLKKTKFIKILKFSNN